MSKPILQSILSLLVVLWTAQAKDTNNEVDLGILQKGVQSNVLELETKLVLLVREMKDTDPDQAKRLEFVLNLIREGRIAGRMDEVSKMLNQKRFQDATDDQKQLIADLMSIWEQLQQRQESPGELKQRIEALEKMRDQLSQLKEEQQKAAQSTQRSQNAEKAIKSLEDFIKRLKIMIKVQSDVIAETDKSKEAGKREVEQVLSKLLKLRAASKKLAQDITQELNAGDTSLGPAPGVKPLAAAFMLQGSSLQSLAKLLFEKSLKTQNGALTKYKEALAELQSEFELMKKNKQEMAEAMKKAQQQKQEQTDQLAKEMQKQNKDDELSEAMKSMSKASQSMEKASESMEQQKMEESGEEQKEAAEELAKAEEELDEALLKLKAELLQAFKDYLQKMLDEQEELHRVTQIYEKSMPKKEERKPSDKVTIEGVADKEAAVREDGRSALKILVDDGTSMVFPPILRSEVIKNLDAIIAKMQEGEIGKSTQLRQEIVIRTLQDMIDVLNAKSENEQEESEEQKQQQQREQEEPKLIDMLAELRLIRNTQANLNKTTEMALKTKETELVPELTERQKHVYMLLASLVLQKPLAPEGEEETTSEETQK